MDEKNFYCSVCGCELEEDEICDFDGQIYCEDCLDEVTTVCECCGERFINEEIISDMNHSVCNSCFESYYTYCEGCNCIINRDSAYYLDNYDDYCYSCYQKELENKSIHDYGYKPEPKFRGSGTRYIGVELECDEGGKDEDNAAEILEIANKHFEENIYIKYDGSLSDGFEIVSHPMTLQYHKEIMPWEKVLKVLVSLDYLSHKTNTCGLHCHINRNSLGIDSEAIDETVARILYFVEHHWDKLLKFSRRTESQMRRWANRYGIKDKAKDFIYEAKNKCYSRYVCVNLNNHSTIEFRIFRGTLKYNTFIATLELVNEICELCTNHSDEEVEIVTWSDFVNLVENNENKELIIYLKERNLY